MSGRVPAEQERLAPSNFRLEMHRLKSSPGRGLSSFCPSLPSGCCGSELLLKFSEFLSRFHGREREQHQRERRIWVDGEKSKESFALWQSLESMNRDGVWGVPGFPGSAEVKNLPANAGDAGDTGLIPGSGRSPGIENGNPLQHSCLEESMDRGTWQAIVHGVAKSLTRLRN